jgi:glycolate oxidase iron-sulfur subunit
MMVGTTYVLIEPNAAAELGERKAERIRAVRPDTVAAANPGCLLQVGGWLARGCVQLPTFHPVELVDASLRAYRADRLIDERRRLAASAGP